MVLPFPHNRLLDASVVLGINTKTEKDITLTEEERLRSISVVGGTGTGKTTLITSIALQAIENGESVILFAVEPDIINNLLVRISEERMQDVVLLDFRDRRRFPGINYTAEDRDIERCIELLKRLWNITPETPNLENTLRASLLTLQYNKLTLDRMIDLLRDKEFRARCVPHIPHTVDSQIVREFWEKDFNQHDVQFQIRNADSTLNKIMQMFMDKYIAYIIAQETNTLNIQKHIIEKKKILIIHLSKYDLQAERVRRIGAMVLEEIKSALFSRASLRQHERHIVNLICDEWQLYLTPDFFEDVLSQGRRYGVSTVLATQTLENFDNKLQAIIDQVGTHITFAVGVRDANKLAPFYAKDPPPAETRTEPIETISLNPLEHIRRGRGHSNERVNTLVSKYLTPLFTLTEKYNVKLVPVYGETRQSIAEVRLFFENFISDGGAAFLAKKLLEESDPPKRYFPSLLNDINWFLVSAMKGDMQTAYRYLGYITLAWRLYCEELKEIDLDHSYGDKKNLHLFFPTEQETAEAIADCLNAYSNANPRPSLPDVNRWDVQEVWQPEDAKIEYRHICTTLETLLEAEETSAPAREQQKQVLLTQKSLLEECIFEKLIRPAKDENKRVWKKYVWDTFPKEHAKELMKQREIGLQRYKEAHNEVAAMLSMLDPYAKDFMTEDGKQQWQNDWPTPAKAMSFISNLCFPVYADYHEVHKGRIMDYRLDLYLLVHYAPPLTRIFFDRFHMYYIVKDGKVITYETDPDSVSHRYSLGWNIDKHYQSKGDAQIVSLPAYFPRKFHELVTGHPHLKRCGGHYNPQEDEMYTTLSPSEEALRKEFEQEVLPYATFWFDHRRITARREQLRKKDKEWGNYTEIRGMTALTMSANPHAVIWLRTKLKSLTSQLEQIEHEELLQVNRITELQDRKAYLLTNCRNGMQVVKSPAVDVLASEPFDRLLQARFAFHLKRLYVEAIKTCRGLTERETKWEVPYSQAAHEFLKGRIGLEHAHYWLRTQEQQRYPRRPLPPEPFPFKASKLKEEKTFEETLRQRGIEEYLDGIEDTDPVMQERKKVAWEQACKDVQILLPFLFEWAELAELLSQEENKIKDRSGQIKEKELARRTHADMEKEKAKELLGLPDGIAYVAIRMRGDRFKPRMKTKQLNDLYPRIVSLEKRREKTLENALAYTTEARTIDQEFWKRRQRFRIAPSPVMQPPQEERQMFQEEKEHDMPLQVAKRRVYTANSDGYLPPLTFGEGRSPTYQYLLLLYHFHYLTLKQFCKLLGKTNETHVRDDLNEIIGKVVGKGLITKEPITGKLNVKAGRVPLVYSLTETGMKKLNEELGLSAGTRKGTFSEHTLLVNDALITLVLATKQEPSIRLCELWHERYFKQHNIQVGDKSFLEPDAVLHLQLSPPFGGENEHVGVCLEIDRGSESMLQWQEKVRKYMSLASGVYQKQFGLESLTIAVCQPGGDVKLLARWTEQAVKDKKEHAPLFLFTNSNPVDRDPVEWVTAPVWTGIDNTPYALIEKISQEELIHSVVEVPQPEAYQPYEQGYQAQQPTSDAQLEPAKELDERSMAAWIDYVFRPLTISAQEAFYNECIQLDLISPSLKFEKWIEQEGWKSLSYQVIWAIYKKLTEEGRIISMPGDINIVIPPDLFAALEKERQMEQFKQIEQKRMQEEQEERERQEIKEIARSLSKITMPDALKEPQKPKRQRITPLPGAQPQQPVQPIPTSDAQLEQTIHALTEDLWNKLRDDGLIDPALKFKDWRAQEAQRLWTAWLEKLMDDQS